MSENLVVENFGPVKKAEIVLSELTVLIGTQGSGKSTISKLFTIFRDFSWRLDIIDGNDRVMEPFVRFHIIEFFKDNTYLKYESLEGAVFEFIKGNFQVEPPQAATIDDLRSFYSDKIRTENESFLKKLSVSDSQIDTNSHNVERLLRANSRTTLYVLAERGMISELAPSIASLMLAGVPLSEPMMEFLSLFERAKKSLGDYSVPFLGVTFKRIGGDERLVSLDDTAVSLSAGSSGIQSVLPMIMVIDYSLKSGCFNSFVIEEPEQNLFPDNQRSLVHFLTNSIVPPDGNMILTTHSPYVLSCLNNIILAGMIAELAPNKRDELKDMLGLNRIPEKGFVSVYALNPNAENSSKSLINPKTGLIGINSLDSISDSISSDFTRLMSIYREVK